MHWTSTTSCTLNIIAILKWKLPLESVEKVVSKTECPKLLQPGLNYHTLWYMSTDSRCDISMDESPSSGRRYLFKGGVPYWDSIIMLRLNWQDNFEFLTQRLSQKMRDFGLRVICIVRLKIILPSLNLFLGADNIISVMKLRKKRFLAKMHSFIGVCKISYIKHVLSTKKSPLQLSALS